MQDRPTAPDLLDALAELLFTDVREWVPSDRRFQILVAANLCAVVARELRAGEGPSADDAELFRSLLGEESSDAATDDADAERARGRGPARARDPRWKSRRGARDGRRPLREHVGRKLDVAAARLDIGSRD